MVMATQAATTQYVVVSGTGGQTSSSYVWRIWQQSHSFYVLARHPGVSSVKVSLHGPNGEHPEPLFKIERDRDATATSELSDSVVFGSEVAGVFAGRVVAAGLRHVVTLRWTPGAFRHGAPSGLIGKDPTFGAARVRLPPPKAGELLDMRLYVSDGKPWAPPTVEYLPVLAPLRNDSGQYLTVIAARVRATEGTPMPGLRFPPPRSTSDRVRGIRTAIADDVLWVVEELTSRTALQQWQRDLGAGQ